ncbi:hypothetical protein HYPSUDRAFT_92166 [Hypholoma sublateritium FD-334 SS-4]|uniref:Uncharacterized protein n=1 Tax=Hypholoma sublateritium (strain FD-334 SS-4) TaxID=945553 RepID=A0A0D2N6W6_HYPSF|nr:hypothetical protein HYPSUDRAFT_92166 [Hypholoma sublateritium FD-334 SS-4]
MPPSRETLKEKLLQWRYDTAVRRSNEGRVAMFGTAWIMSDTVLDHLASCAAEDRIRTTHDLQREAHDWPADKRRDLGESLMAVILAASAPPAPAPLAPSLLKTERSKARKRKPPVCAVCKITGHKRDSVRCAMRPKWLPRTPTGESSTAEGPDVAVPSTVKQYYRPKVFAEQPHASKVVPTNDTQDKRVLNPAAPDASSTSAPRALAEVAAAQDTHVSIATMVHSSSPPAPTPFDDRYPRFELLQNCVFPPEAFPRQNYFADPPV